VQDKFPQVCQELETAIRLNPRCKEAVNALGLPSTLNTDARSLPRGTTVSLALASSDASDWAPLVSRTRNRLTQTWPPQPSSR
jgi:hypothetical protein